MTSKELTAIIDGFNAVRPSRSSVTVHMWRLCVNSFVTHSVTRNTLTEQQVDDFYEQLNQRRL